MTETGMITSNPYDGERRAGSVGYPLPGISVRIADEAGHQVAPAMIGVIEVKGPNVFKGYWGMPEETRKSFRPTAISSPATLASWKRMGASRSSAAARTSSFRAA
jgi:long-subunit acyl-CoA synthetase (AMP-forming)